MPPSAVTNTDQVITPQSSSFAEVLFYAVPRFSDMLRRLSDIKNSAASKPLKMSPSTGLWLTLALIGLIISANSYFVGFQELAPDPTNLTTVIPLGREDTIFRPMALIPPLLNWLAAVVNFGTGLVSLALPESLQVGIWNPADRPTVWSNATLALAWWVGAFGSILISSTQGLFTRTTSLGKQREYAARLNKIARIELNPKAIAPAKREVAKANNWGRGAVWAMCLLAVAGWGWELFVANGALTGTTFDLKSRWIYGIASTFMAELCWFVAQRSGREIDTTL
jgi:hypothetical protein